MSTAWRDDRRQPLDRKPFVCKDYRPRRSNARPRGIPNPPPFVDTIELVRGRKINGKFFCRNTSTTRHNASSRHVRCVGACRPRRIPRPRCTGVALRSVRTFGDGSGSAAFGQDVVVDHPQRVGQQRSAWCPRRPNPTCSTPPWRRDRRLGRCHLFDPTGSASGRGSGDAAAVVSAAVVPAVAGRPGHGPFTGRGGRPRLGRPRAGRRIPLDGAGPGAAGAPAPRRRPRRSRHAHRPDLGGSPPGPAGPTDPGRRAAAGPPSWPATCSTASWPPTSGS